MDFVLFLLVNAILFLRPSEIFPELAQVGIYEAAIICCIVFSALSLVGQFSLKSLTARPITVGVLLLCPLCGLSQVMRMDLGLAGEAFVAFFKIAIYYLLLVGIVNTPARLRYFLIALGVFITVLTLIAVLRYNDVITINPPPIISKKDIMDGTANNTTKADGTKKDDGTAVSVEDKYFDPRTGEEVIVRRLRGTGIFADPNDLCLALVTGVLLCFYGLGETRLGGARLLWLGPLCLFLFALRLTASRGGLLGLLAGLGVLFAFRYGWRRTMLLGAVAAPVVLVVFGGRMTDVSDVNSGTGQTRLQLWREGMVLFREQPLFGIGMNEYGNDAGQVAHNSFLHAFTELGVVGGGVFLGLFYCAFFGLRQIQQARVLDPDMRRMLPYMLAMVAGYAVGILSLSRCYEVPTYTMLGITTAYIAVVSIYPPWAKLTFSTVLVQRIIGCSVIFLLFTDIVVRFFAV
jgi:hypothetical protein